MGKDKVRLNLYIRSDFVDLVPFEGVIILRARVLSRTDIMHIGLRKENLLLLGK